MKDFPSSFKVTDLQMRRPFYRARIEDILDGAVDRGFYVCRHGDESLLCAVDSLGTAFFFHINDDTATFMSDRLVKEHYCLDDVAIRLPPEYKLTLEL